MVIFDETRSDTTNDFSDMLRDESALKPDYKATSADIAPITTQNTTIIKALHKWNAKDYENFGIRVQEPNGVLRLKTMLTDAPALMRCRYIIPNYDSSMVIQNKFILLRQPYQIGLQVDRYCVTYWRQV